MKTLALAPVIGRKDRTLLLNVKRAVQRVVQSATVLLYGSTARGERGPGSDYDLLILTDKPLSDHEAEAVHNAVYELELSHGVVLSTIYYTKRDWDAPVNAAMPFHERVEQDAVVL